MLKTCQRKEKKKNVTFPTSKHSKKQFKKNKSGTANLKYDEKKKIACQTFSNEYKLCK